MNMRNAILFLVVLVGILQPTCSFANGVLDTRTTKDKHYTLEETRYSPSHSLEGLSISFSRKHVSCKGQNDGKLIAQVAGGTTPYQYQWSTGATTESIEELVAGVYRLTVTDATGQQKSSGVKITEPEQLILRASVQHVSCGATKDGRMEVVAEGGRAPYQYTWEIGGSGTVRENMPAGKYPVSVLSLIHISEPTRPY